jgi:hypothetical protein
MHLTNRTSTITVAVVAALVALAIVAHASGALTFSPSHPAWHGTVHGHAAASQRRWSNSVRIDSGCASF